MKPIIRAIESYTCFINRLTCCVNRKRFRYVEHVRIKKFRERKNDLRDSSPRGRSHV